MEQRPDRMTYNRGRPRHQPSVSPYCRGLLRYLRGLAVRLDGRCGLIVPVCLRTPCNLHIIARMIGGKIPTRKHAFTALVLWLLPSHSFYRRRVCRLRFTPFQLIHKLTSRE